MTAITCSQLGLVEFGAAHGGNGCGEVGGENGAEARSSPAPISSLHPENSAKLAPDSRMAGKPEITKSFPGPTQIYEQRERSFHSKSAPPVYSLRKGSCGSQLLSEVRNCINLRVCNMCVESSKAASPAFRESLIFNKSHVFNSRRGTTAFRTVMNSQVSFLRQASTSSLLTLIAGMTPAISPAKLHTNTG